MLNYLNIKQLEKRITKLESAVNVCVWFILHFCDTFGHKIPCAVEDCDENIKFAKGRKLPKMEINDDGFVCESCVEKGSK